MKIGILTLPLETNYGGILQAFALQTILRKMGNDVITIDRHRDKRRVPLWVRIGGYLKRNVQHYLMCRKNVSSQWNIIMSDEEYNVLSSYTQPFINKNIKLTRKIFSSQLEQVEDEYKFDAYVVGSDQVWLEKYCPNSFLDFVHRPNVKKVAYAASCGRKSFFNNPSKVIQCRQLAKSFSGISVRENYLVKECKEKLEVDAHWVLDPTMLLNKQDYLDVAGENKSTPPILFTYILDQNEAKQQIVKMISDNFKLEIVNGNALGYYKKGASLSLNDCIFPPVEDWINNMNRADFVVTDSFHGTVFSILFNKQFVTIANVRRGLMRFQSLLSMFGLENRMVTNYTSSQISKLLNTRIDYNPINEKRKELVTQSILFLEKSLSK